MILEIIGSRYSLMINKPPVDPEKHTLAGRTCPLSPYKGVHPPPPRVAILSVKRDFFLY